MQSFLICHLHVSRSCPLDNSVGIVISLTSEPNALDGQVIENGGMSVEFGGGDKGFRKPVTPTVGGNTGLCDIVMDHSY